MRGTRVVFLVVLAFACVFAAGAVILSDESLAGDEDKADGIRIGTFDSRAVTIAYAQSKSFQMRADQVKALHNAAKKEGNEERVKELEAAASEMQDLLHKQGFGTWPVDDILERIEDEIPKIAEEAGVDIIVSKWDVVYQKPGVELINITEFIVKPFNPGEETMQAVIEIPHQQVFISNA